MWNTINKLTNKKSKTTKITKLKVSEENFTEDSNEISNTFNTFFSTIGSNLANDLPETIATPECYVIPQNSNFHLQSVSVADIFKLLTTLKVSKACAWAR